MPTARLAGLLVLAACQSYVARPLDPDETLKRIEAEREAGDLTFAAARERLRTHGPRVLEARAAYEAAQAVADVRTPLPNPTLEFGPTLLEGGRSGVEGALGWTVWLRGRRKLTDDLNAVTADAARIEAASVLREEYLGLRREWVAAAFAEEELRLREILDAPELSVAILGPDRASALKKKQAVLRRGLATVKRDAAQARVWDAHTALAERLGARPGSLGRVALPRPPAVPDRERLVGLLVRDHPALASRRARYQVAEKALRLEIAKQYPALHIGPLFEREEGTTKFGLVLGIELPIFDRNQPGIAAAIAGRARVRIAYEAAVARQLARLDGAISRLAHARKRADAVVLDLDGLQAWAGRAARAGTIAVSDYVDLMLELYEARLELLSVRRAHFDAWLDLEDACGAPLLDFEEAVRKEKNP